MKNARGYVNKNDCEAWEGLYWFTLVSGVRNTMLYVRRGRIANDNSGTTGDGGKSRTAFLKA